MLVALVLISVVASSQAHPHHGFFNGGDSPRFYPQNYNRHPEYSGPPTVNIFKIYAPRQIFVNGYDSKKEQQIMPDFTSKDKQMISSPVSIIDRILGAEDIIPNEIMDDSPYYYNQFEESFEPQASSVVSRKLPAFHEPDFDMDHSAGFSRGINPGMFSDNRIMDHPNNRGLPFLPNMHMNHDEHCDHTHENELFNNFPVSLQMNELNEYPGNMAPSFPDYDDTPMFETPMFDNPNFKPHAMTLTRLSPLMSFFETIASNVQAEPEDYDREVMTTVTYGEPEIINEKNENEPQEIEIQEYIPVEAINVEPEANTDDTDSSEEDVVEINRSFVKTILPDNTSVTREVPNLAEDNSETADDGSVEEIEVNVIKTILPDNTYTVSEVITGEKSSNESS